MAKAVFPVCIEEETMANFKIITNNPMAAAKYSQPAVFLNTNPQGIFIACRDAVHQGCVLISHPLSGSIKPNESPYKSIVISDKKTGLDHESLQIIESALNVVKKLRVKNIRYSADALNDFQVIDLDLLDSAIFDLPSGYHLN